MIVINQNGKEQLQRKTSLTTAEIDSVVVGHWKEIEDAGLSVLNKGNFEDWEKAFSWFGKPMNFSEAIIGYKRGA